MSSLQTLAFRAMKSVLAAKSDIAMPVTYSNYFLVAWFDKCNTAWALSVTWLSGSR